jgi:hypothetical protein
MCGTPTRPTYNEENRKLKESAEHWHKLYLARCLIAQDDAARSGYEIEALEVEIEALKSPTDTSQSHTCTWPTCKSEAYQDALATQVHAELIGQKPVDVVNVWSDEKPCSEGYDILTVSKIKRHFGVRP